MRNFNPFNPYDPCCCFNSLCTPIIVRGATGITGSTGNTGATVRPVQQARPKN